MKQSFQDLKTNEPTKKIQNPKEVKTEKSPENRPPKPKSLMEHFNLHSTILDDRRPTILDAKLLQQAVTSNFYPITMCNIIYSSELIKGNKNVKPASAEEIQEVLKKAQEMLKGTQIFATLSSSSLLNENIHENSSKKQNLVKSYDPIHFFEKNQIHHFNSTNTLPITETLFSNLRETKIPAYSNDAKVTSKDSNPNTFKDSNDVLNIKMEAAKKIQQSDEKSVSSKTSSKKKSTLASEKRAQLDMINRSLIKFYDNNKNNDFIERASNYSSKSKASNHSTTSKLSALRKEDDDISKLIRESLSTSDNSAIITALFNESKLERVLKSSYNIEFFHLIKAEIESLNDANEILQSKLNAIRFDLKSRDITVDDLKIKIAQLYVELESAKMAKKNLEKDKTLLINEIELLGKDKQRYYSELVQASQKKDSLQKSLDQLHLAMTEQEGYIQKLKNENQSNKNQVMETKIKALKEKEELVKHLESIEADIISRERALHKNEYEKIMLEKVQYMTNEKEKYVKIIESLSNNLEQKTAALNSLEQQLIIHKNESNSFKTKYTNTQMENSHKTHESEKLKLKINEVNEFNLRKKEYNQYIK